MKLFVCLPPKENLPFCRYVLKTVSRTRSFWIESPKGFNLWMLIISWSWVLFESKFLIIWRMSSLEKWQLAHEFSVSKVNCVSNTLFVRYKGTLFGKKRIEDFTLFFEINILLLWKLGRVLCIFCHLVEFFNKV